MPPQTNANKENPNRNDHNKKEDEDSGLVTQTHDAKHAKKDYFIQPSPAQKTAKNIKLNSHSHANQKTSVTS